MASVFVRCNSHRARHRLKSLLGTLPKCYWSFDHPAKGGIYPIPEEKLDAARKIPGITRAAKVNDVMECW